MYDQSMVDPLIKELTDFGFESLTDASTVSEKIENMQGTALVVVNSICGCAAAGARPGVLKSLNHDTKPDNLYTVFAGQYPEATNKARSYFHGFSPSSPSIALMKDGQVVHMLERTDIEGNSPDAISDSLTFAYNRHLHGIDGETTVEVLVSRFPGFAKKITEKVGADSGALSSHSGDVQELIYAIEDILDAEPEIVPVEFTPEGAAKFDEFRKKEGEDNACLALTGQGMGFKDGADDNDLIFESNGMTILVDKSSAKRYSGRKVHFAEGPQGGGFTLI